MESLKELAETNAAWSLIEFVELVNRLLPQYLPEIKARVREEINPRLVRHYGTQGLIDEPHRQGKFAVYNYRHLLQLLVVRRLQSEGIAVSAIAVLVKKKTNTELENLLSGGVELNIAPANPALSFLEKVKNRNLNQEDHNIFRSYAASAPKFALEQVESSLWQRIEIAPGLEIHIKSDFKFPKTPQEKETILALIAEKLSPPNKE